MYRQMYFHTLNKKTKFLSITCAKHQTSPYCMESTKIFFRVLAQSNAIYRKMDCYMVEKLTSKGVFTKGIAKPFWLPFFPFSS